MIPVPVISFTRRFRPSFSSPMLPLTAVIWILSALTLAFSSSVPSRMSSSAVMVTLPSAVIWPILMVPSSVTVRSPPFWAMPMTSSSPPLTALTVTSFVLLETMLVAPTLSSVMVSAPLTLTAPSAPMVIGLSLPASVTVSDSMVLPSMALALTVTSSPPRKFALEMVSASWTSIVLAALKTVSSMTASVPVTVMLPSMASMALLASMRPASTVTSLCLETTVVPPRLFLAVTSTLPSSEISVLPMM